ncbi:MAG TPA: ABC transporter substrate-binding protein [Dehalococcoidia bacterium]|nr:ABC transporter substrate-binding protein [Dehalococcoidia bacterium]
MFALIRRGAVLLVIVVAGVLIVACGGGEKEAADEGTPGSASGGTVQGVTDTEILLGTHYPLSNSPAAVYANSAYAIEAYFDYVNDQGGVNGRKLKLLIEDDQYNPSLSAEVVRKLVEQDKVFAIANGLGDPGHYAVYKYLEEKGIPDLFLGGGIPAFSDPPGKLRFVSIPSYDTEVRAELAYLKEHYSGKKIGLLVQSDEAGKGSEEVFRQRLEESGIDLEIVDREYYDFTQSDMTSQTQRLKAANPDLVIFMSAPAQAANVTKVARELLSWDVPFITGIVAGGDFYVSLAGPAAEGTIGMTYGPYLYTKGAEQVWQEQRDVMKQYKPDVELNSQTSYGWGVAQLIVKALEAAGPDLTPESVAKGAESIKDWCGDLAFSPVNLGPDDHRPNEVIQFVQVKDGKWEFTGEYASVETTPDVPRTTCPLFDQVVPASQQKQLSPS